jgi:hypothetical protein
MQRQTIKYKFAEDTTRRMRPKGKHVSFDVSLISQEQSRSKYIALNSMVMTINETI